jgi:hypothetical protein
VWSAPGTRESAIDDQVPAFDEARFAHLVEEDDPTRAWRVVPFDKMPRR